MKKDRQNNNGFARQSTKWNKQTIAQNQYSNKGIELNSITNPTNWILRSQLPALEKLFLGQPISFVSSNMCNKGLIDN